MLTTDPDEVPVHLAELHQFLLQVCLFILDWLEVIRTFKEPMDFTQFFFSDGTKAELPEWRSFDCFDDYPAEVMFLEGHGESSNIDNKLASHSAVYHPLVSPFISSPN